MSQQEIFYEDEDVVIGTKTSRIKGATFLSKRIGACRIVQWKNPDTETSFRYTKEPKPLLPRIPEVWSFLSIFPIFPCGLVLALAITNKDVVLTWVAGITLPILLAFLVFVTVKKNRINRENLARVKYNDGITEKIITPVPGVYMLQIRHAYDTYELKEEAFSHPIRLNRIKDAIEKVMSDS
jgi:hypothetical protein